MSHEVQIYIKQKEFLQSKSIVRPYTDDPITYKHFDYVSRPPGVKSNKIKVMNSMNPILDKFWADENLDTAKLVGWRATNKKIILMDWDCERPEDSITSEDTVLPYDQDNNIYIDHLYYDNPDELLFIALSRNPKISTFISEKYCTESEPGDPILDRVNIQRRWPIFKFDNNLVYGLGGWDNNTYRLYLGSRLLTERFYPVEQGGNYQVVESVGLDMDGTLRLASDYDLIIEKIVVDGVEIEVNSVEHELVF